MKFYNRETELQQLESVRQNAQERAQMTFIVGRRRIGKTRLVREAYQGQAFIYFFVSRKNEALLCQEFISEVEKALGKRVLGEFRTFARLFEYLLNESKQLSFTLVIDEFQEFANINVSIYSDMQHLWDIYKEDARINLVLSGSVYSMMKKIFENSKEPLFGRATGRMHLKPFNVDVLKQIYREVYPEYKTDDLLAFYMLTGGVAKYVELFVDSGIFTLDSMLDDIFRDNSLLLDEGRNILIEEFGRDYTTYFSILSLIASAKTSRRDIESMLGKSVGGYLDKLENEYDIIKTVKPFNSKPQARNQKYFIRDNFLSFWFRFIYKNRTAIEIANYDFVKNIVKRDYQTYSGLFLERFIREKLMLSKAYSNIGSWWERDNKNEIDIVAVNELEKKLLFAEIKRNKTKINLDKLKEKSLSLKKQFSSFQCEYEGFSLDDL